MTLQYLMTGEERYKDALLSCFDHILRVKDNPPSTNEEIRNQARGIDALVNGYRLTGNADYVAQAYDIFASHLLDKEGGDGSRTGWIQSNDKSSGIWVGYDAIMPEPLVKLHISLKQTGKNSDAEALFSFLHRWGNWIKDDFYPSYGENSCGTYRNNKTEYFPYNVKLGWDAATGTWNPGTHDDAEYSLTYADLFAHLYNEVGDSSWLNLARSVFKDYHMYSAAEFVPINLTPTTSGLVTAAGSGNWKIAKAITKPMYYIKTEWEVNNPGGDPDKRPMPPSHLRVETNE